MSANEATTATSTATVPRVTSQKRSSAVAKKKPKPVVVGTGRASVNQAGAIPLKITLSSKGKALLRKLKKRVKITIKTIVADRASNKRTLTTALTLR